MRAQHLVVMAGEVLFSFMPDAFAFLGKIVTSMTRCLIDADTPQLALLRFSATIGEFKNFVASFHQCITFREAIHTSL